MKRINNADSLIEKFKKEKNYSGSNEPDAVAMFRVSTKEQADEGFSLEDQKQRILAYCKEEGLNLIKTWESSETASKHGKRKDFNEMLRFVMANPNIKHIIFSHQSRVNRNRESAREVEDIIRNNRVTLHCVRERLRLTKDSGITEWLQWDLFNNLNAEYSVRHTLNVVGGLVKRIEQGLAPIKAPIGYRNKRLDSNKLSVFVIHKQEAKVVVEAFEAMSTGRYSIKGLHEYLIGKFPSMALSKRIPSVKYLDAVLRNVFYIQKFNYDGNQYEGHHEYHPRLISDQLWSKVQKVISGRGHKRGSTTHNFAYTGLLQCGGHLMDKEDHCEYAISGERKVKKLISGEEREHLLWGCSNNRTKCSQRDAEYRKEHQFKRYINQRDLESQMEAIFTGLQFPDSMIEWMKELLVKHHDQTMKLQNEEAKELRQLLTKVDEEEKMTFEKYIKESNQFIQSKLKEHIEKLHQDRERINNELELIQSEKDDYQDKAIKVIELAQRADIAYKKASSENKRKLVEIVASNLTLKNGSLEYHYRKPFNLLVNLSEKEKWWRIQGSLCPFSSRSN
ncbi:MAG: recombinase family protein [Bacteriovoracaceae bacterium]|nr:recombinase family protein [Bacteriovoracaceae bacterium]